VHKTLQQLSKTTKAYGSPPVFEDLTVTRLILPSPELNSLKKTLTDSSLADASKPATNNSQSLLSSTLIALSILVSSVLLLLGLNDAALISLGLVEANKSRSIDFGDSL
jgi:hypothetical protein